MRPTRAPSWSAQDTLIGRSSPSKPSCLRRSAVRSRFSRPQRTCSPVSGFLPIRTAQERFGKKPLTREQVCWGPENLDLTADRLKQLGFEGELRPIKVSCADHEGARVGRIQTWDGKAWKISSDWYTSDDSVIAPMVKEAAAKYAAEKKIATGCLLTN